MSDKPIRGFALVRCKNEIHRISIENGCIILHDHPSLSVDMVVAALSDDAPACLRLYAMWMDDRLTNDVPPELHASFAAHLAKGRHQHSKGNHIRKGEQNGHTRRFN